MKTEMQLQN